MINILESAVEIDGTMLTVVPETEETESTTVEEGKVPTGYEEDHCFSHWAMLLLTLAFSIYWVVRLVTMRNRSANNDTAQDVS